MSADRAELNQGDSKAAADATQKNLAWMLLLAFLLISNIGGGLMLATRSESAKAFTMLEIFGSIGLLWHWLQAQCRPHGIRIPMGLGLLFLVCWPAVSIAYLWRAERWGGVWKTALLLVAFVLGILVRAGVFAAFNGRS